MGNNGHDVADYMSLYDRLVRHADSPLGEDSDEMGALKGDLEDSLDAYDKAVKEIF